MNVVPSEGYILYCKEDKKDKERKTEGGIYIPAGVNEDEEFEMGKVIRSWPGSDYKNGNVLLFSGAPIKSPDGNYLIHENSVIARIE